jgi:hypothetical protein
MLTLTLGGPLNLPRLQHIRKPLPENCVPTKTTSLMVRTSSTSPAVNTYFCIAESIGEPGARQEVRNERALLVYNRVQHKLTGSSLKSQHAEQVYLTIHFLTGKDFDPDVPLAVAAQVDKLILQATSLENLCQCFSGWCVFDFMAVCVLIVTKRLFSRCAFW